MRRLYGGFLRRLGAGVIDLAILLVVFFLYFIALLVSGLAAVGANKWVIDPELFFARATQVFVIFQLWCLVTWFFYYTFFHGVVGKTPGKMVMGLKVYLSSGEELATSIAFLRTAGYLLSAVVFFLGFFWVLVDKKKRAWHDLIAGTVVVREGKTP
ncbi:MAG TPA: RDD family protein [Syntrophales bacterium]|nr:RDD family protein [Syntrophales bacterium]HOL59430.1 RDD family protein [Syntrophales bacterium]HPO35587.1 RDD family protein [Syntrophales bacterium]